MKYISMKWKRPFVVEQVEGVLTTMAEIRPRGMVVFEIRGGGGRDIQYLIGASENTLPKIRRAFQAHGEVTFRELIEDPGGGYYIARSSPVAARSLKITRAKLSLNTDVAEGMLRSGLATLSQLGKNSSAVIQIILGAAYAPAMVVSNQSDMSASWLDVVLGNVQKASSEQMKSMREKVGQYTYDAVIRIGASGHSATSILNSLTGVFRTMSSAGVRVSSKTIDPMDIVTAKIPWRMPLRLSVTELAVSMLLPTGTEEYPGTRDIHPMDMIVPAWYRSPTAKTADRTFAVAPDPAGKDDLKLSISPRDALEHTMILGPTGAGKSTVMLNLIMSDINAGRSVLVIDPKADLVSDILSRMPEERMDDLVVIDPSDDTAVGWNPLNVSNGHPELTADAILAVFQDIFSENWGIRAQDILSAALLTLASRKDATLMWLPSLLTDENFRNRVIKGTLDPIALKPFWEQYNAMKESERRAMIESSLNKVRQIMFRPGLRNVLGQAHPKFQLKELFTKRKIVLVPLNKGLIGSDSARLLGSLLVGMAWIEALSRANIPKEKRHIVSMYIDELQDYVSLPGSFADSLAQARGLGLAITVAHQYRAQLDSNLREGIDANCRNKIIFGLSSSDASTVSHLSNELKPIDFMSLPRYHIYTNFMVRGRATGWVSATTLPPQEPIRLPAEAKAMSQTKYGKPSKEVEEEIILALYPKTRNDTNVANSALDPNGTFVELKDIEQPSTGKKDVNIGAKFEGGAP
ncbi:type IV secretion system DNA-binding domain-containing protein [Candidatus Saccharibacteria bacterium]|nr:type IV secretion system DNA-binding domain-containing protein [Candidatus Saccharibacteria bacterium]